MASSKVTSLKPSSEEQEGLIVKILQNKSLLINLVLSLILVGLVIGVITQKVNRRVEKNASMVFSSLDEKDQLVPHADLKKLIKIANKYSFLRAHLDAPLAQECLNQNEIDQANHFNERVKKRLNQDIKPLFEFNQISLLIGQKDYQEALKTSYQLKNKLDKEAFPSLYAFHLLRLAQLEKKCQHPKQYQERINDFITWKANQEQSREVLDIGRLSIDDFIKQELK